MSASDNPQVVYSSFTLKTFTIAALSGGIAGTSIDFVLFPIDSIKTRLQASNSQKNFVKDAATVSKFKGVASQMAASFPCAAAFWLSYEYSKFLLKRYSDSFLNVHMQHIFASSTAETCQALVRCPFEVVKQNMQIGRYATMKAAVYNIFESKGVMGFYTGFRSFLLRDIPFSAI